MVERHGDPAIGILDEAVERRADLIVIGTRGLSTAERWLIGSVSTKVLHHAQCSVVRPDVSQHVAPYGRRSVHERSERQLASACERALPEAG